MPENLMPNKEEIKEEPAMPKLLDLVDRLEKANARAEEFLKKQEEMIARNLLGGQTTNAVLPAPKEESPRDYVKRVMSNRL